MILANGGDFFGFLQIESENSATFLRIKLDQIQNPMNTIGGTLFGICHIKEAKILMIFLNTIPENAKISFTRLTIVQFVKQKTSYRNFVLPLFRICGTTCVN
jgi:hypothetical protein